MSLFERSEKGEESRWWATPVSKQTWLSFEAIGAVKRGEGAFRNSFVISEGASAPTTSQQEREPGIAARLRREGTSCRRNQILPWERYST